MKYKLVVTLEFVFWMLFGIASAVLMSMSSLTVSDIGLSPSVTVAVMVGAILVGAVVSVLLLRYFERLWVQLRFVFGLFATVLIVLAFGSAFTDGVKYMADAWGKNLSVNPLVLIGLSGVLFVISTIFIANKYQVWLFVRFTNVVFLTIMASAAAVFSNFLTPLWFVVLLCVLAVYDAVAVWKLKTMQEMAMGLAEKGFVLGIGVPKDDGNVALVGGGDIFLMSLGTIVMVRGTQFGLGASLGMMFALMLLLVYARKDRFYPALPFILAGLGVGMAVQWFVVVMGTFGAVLMAFVIMAVTVRIVYPTLTEVLSDG